MNDLISRQAAIAVADYSDYAGLSVDDVKKVTDEVVKGLRHLPSAQQWIPCSERLPNICEDILFSVADLYTAEGCLRDDGDWWQFRWDSIIPKDRVTAWMPLPKPWKGENNERL